MKAEKAITKIVLDTFSQNPSWIEDDNGNIITKQVIRERAIELLIDDELSMFEICTQILSEYDMVSKYCPKCKARANLAIEVANFQLHPNGGI